MGYFAIFGIILSFSIVLTIILKKRIEQVIPIAIVEIVLIVFIAGIFDNLKLGVNILQIFSIIQLVFIFISIIKADKDKKIKEIVGNIATPRFINLYYIVYY